ncbi:MAG: hypothetical protein ABSG28_02065 [Methanoregula sp.]
MLHQKSKFFRDKCSLINPLPVGFIPPDLTIDEKTKQPRRDVQTIAYLNKKDGKSITFWDIWQGSKTDSIFNSIQPNAERVKHVINIKINPEFPIALIGKQGFADIEGFTVIAEFWIEEKRQPLTCRKYEGNDGIVSEMVEAESIINGEPGIFAIHRKPEKDGRTTFSVSTRSLKR